MRPSIASQLGHVQEHLAVATFVCQSVQCPRYSDCRVCKKISLLCLQTHQPAKQQAYLQQQELVWLKSDSHENVLLCENTWLQGQKIHAECWQDVGWNGWHRKERAYLILGQCQQETCFQGDIADGRVNWAKQAKWLLTRLSVQLVSCDKDWNCPLKMKMQGESHFQVLEGIIHFLSEKPCTNDHHPTCPPFAFFGVFEMLWTPPLR